MAAMAALCKQCVPLFVLLLIAAAVPAAMAVAAVLDDTAMAHWVHHVALYHGDSLAVLEDPARQQLFLSKYELAVAAWRGAWSDGDLLPVLDHRAALLPSEHLHNGSILEIGTDMAAYEELKSKQYHILQVGDTCSSLSQMYNIAVPVLEKHNPRLRCSALPPPGTPLFVGFAVNVVCSPQCSRTHVVKEGDTCSSLAAEYSLSSHSRFLSINPGLDCAEQLKVGSTVCTSDYHPSHGALSDDAAAPMRNLCSKVYVAAKNDTCESVAGRFGLELSTFFKKNPGVICPAIPAGLELCVDDAKCADPTWQNGCTSPCSLSGAGTYSCAVLAARHGLSIACFNCNNNCRCNSGGGVLPSTWCDACLHSTCMPTCAYC